MPNEKGRDKEIAAGAEPIAEVQHRRRETVDEYTVLKGKYGNALLNDRRVKRAVEMQKLVVMRRYRERGEKVPAAWVIEAEAYESDAVQRAFDEYEQGAAELARYEELRQLDIEVINRDQALFREGAAEPRSMRYGNGA